MKRETQNVLLVLTGGALLKIAIGGSYLRYVRPEQQPFLVAAGVVVLALAATAIVRDIRAAHARNGHAQAGQGADACAGPELPCGHAAGAHARSAWFLVLPVLAILVVAPPALGSGAVQRDSANAAASKPGDSGASTEFPPLPPGEVVPLDLNEFVARAGWDSRDSLRGRTVRLTGFVVRDGEQVLLARLVIRCCAADATPVTVVLRGHGALDGQGALRGSEPAGVGLGRLRSDEWIEVTGRLGRREARQGDRYEPPVQVRHVRRIPQPDHPYEQ